MVMHRKIKRSEHRKRMHVQANACASGKTRYRKWFEKRITTAKRKWNASNDEKLQKADKTALRSAKGPQTAEKAESEKRGLFHSPIFHITCIMRNMCNQKIQVSSLFRFRVWRPVCECIVWNRIVLSVHLFFQFRESPASCSDCGCVPKYSQIAS